MKKALFLSTLTFLIQATALAGSFRTIVYCHESEPVPNEKSIYAVEIVEEEGRAANWINVLSVNAYDVHDKTIVLRQLVEQEAGSIEKKIVVHKLRIKDYTRLSISYPYGKRDLGYLPSALILKIEDKYVKVPMRCSHVPKLK